MREKVVHYRLRNTSTIKDGERIGILQGPLPSCRVPVKHPSLLIHYLPYWSRRHNVRLSLPWISYLSRRVYVCPMQTSPVVSIHHTSQSDRIVPLVPCPSHYNLCLHTLPYTPGAFPNARAPTEPPPNKYHNHNNYPSNDRSTNKKLLLPLPMSG